ncbi:haloacid dehalogenase [Zopfia rhizophila CBS 207.26]|uniref:Haloacid dehalogenase n=1 Tax=Zopfia rhizophila CBS 207.26 TaxID=1314779 RepID=A0A6A6E9X0_9PEZI|nr:haloacid dehalogenase [Zopfia rhizophila CBS 207.26]
MSKLTDYCLLSFDVYGTLIDWETGILDALQPLLKKNNKTDFSRQYLLQVTNELESPQQSKTPEMIYSELLATILPHIATKLGIKEPPTAEESKAFGDSVGKWPAFSDTVDALKRLHKHYKLVVLSNVDRESFAKTNAGPLEGFPFDLVITAQDIGSYKPDLRNFEYMLKEVKEKFGVEKSEVLQTAQSQFHDHHAAKKMGIKSSWIVRRGATMGNRPEEIYDWKFDTLGEMADALEKELGK